MKSLGPKHPQNQLAPWETPQNARRGMLGRLKQITADIEAIQTDLHNQLTQPVALPNFSLLEDVAAVQAITKFKTELDQLRRVLWFCIEQASGQIKGRDDRALQTEQLQHFTDLLRVLTPKPCQPALAGEEQPGSFFERLDHVIDSYMDEKGPLSRGTKRQ